MKFNLKERYKILILTSPQNRKMPDDNYIKEAFEKDGHEVKMMWIDYDEKLDEEFDVIIRRNTWIETEEETEYYQQKNEALKQRIEKKGIKAVNLEGLDGKGKRYLCNLYKNNKDVIPTVDNLEDIKKFEQADEYVLKDEKSFGNGLGQRIVRKDELKEKFRKGDLIQPKLKFKGEVQCYFVGEKLMYALEYIPSKYPNWPEPKKVQLSAEERKLAEEFSKVSKLEAGFQRVDFLRLENNKLKLLEIEDHSPFMNLNRLDEKLRNEVIEEYKENIYKYINTTKQGGRNV